MKIFLTKIVILFFPIILFLSLILIIDPFQYFYSSTLISLENKKKVSQKINPVLWKILRFREHPMDIIVLGDSRAGRFHPSDIANISEENIYNFSLEGGTLSELIKTFWWANGMVELKKVYMCVNFNLFNNNNVRDRFTGAVSLLDNFILYLINRNVLSASFYIIRNTFSENIKALGKPNLTRDVFWNKLLKDWSTRYYATYQYPDSLHSELKKMAFFCANNNIQLVFIIPPTHISMQKMTEFYNLRKENARFIDELKQLGTVYDFDYPNEVTKNRQNFSDPVHIRSDSTQSIIKQVWGGEKGPGRVYDPVTQ